jgi:hypothetical protein
VQLKEKNATEAAAQQQLASKNEELVARRLRNFYWRNP